MAIYIYIYISADLSRASSVLDSTSLPTTSSHFLPPTSRSKAQKRTSIQPAQVARQLKSRNPTLQAPRQLESWNLNILSSFIRDLLGRNRLPQDATGRQLSGPRLQQISLNRCSRPHRSVKQLIWAPWLTQSSPDAPTSLQGPSQVTPQVTKGL